MPTMLDLHPAARQMAKLLENVRDDQLGGPTPCEDYTLGDLVDHVGGLALAFTMAATKEATQHPPDHPSQDPTPAASRLDDEWRARFIRRLDVLADAWDDPEASTGMTRAGGVDLPGEAAGIVALDELVLHGWDIARASGQGYESQEVDLQACMEFVAASASDDGSEGIFAPPIDVPADAPLLDRLVALSGRDPAWRPSEAQPRR